MIQNIKLYLLENNTGQIPGVKENPRDLTGDGFAKAKQSIKDFPEMLEVRTLVVVKHGEMFVVIGGNQRLRAMRDLDYDTAPVMVVDWPVDKINEFIIKDNVEYGVWNFDLLANEWDSNLLVDWGMNLPVDFGDVDDSLIGGQSEVDDVPEAPEVPKSKLGDIWICGKHRVMCGDSTSIDAVERLMPERASMTFTDPPYLMDFTGGIHADGSKSFNAKHGGIKNDKMSAKDGDDFLDAINSIILQKVSGAFYITFYRLGIDRYYASMERTGLKCRSLIIWDKGNHTLSNSDYMSMYEPMFYGWVSDHNFYGGNNGMDIWRIARTSKNDLHPTMKPLELVEKAVSDGSLKGDVVLDLFGGSGSTLIACEKNGRFSRLMELDPKYCDVIVKRWQDFTGKDAILESTQQKFNEL